MSPFVGYLLPGRVRKDLSSLQQVVTREGYLKIPGSSEDLCVEGKERKDGGGKYLIFSKKGGKISFIGSVRRLIVFEDLIDFAYLETSESSSSPLIYPPSISFQKSVHPIEMSLLFSNNRFLIEDSNKKKNDSVIGQQEPHYEVVGSTSSTIALVRFKQGDLIPGKKLDDGNRKEPFDLFHQTIHDKLVEVFDLRPVWMRAPLEEHLSNSFAGNSSSALVPFLSGWRLSAILKLICYFFVDGPWRNCYVRLGYDPRSEIESLAYQVIDFRDPFLRKEVKKGGAESSGKKVTRVGASEIDEGVVDCHFRTAPVKRSQFYQFCDIADTAVQNIINHNMKRGKCDGSTGWLTVDEMDSIRNQLKVKSEAYRRSAAAARSSLVRPTVDG